MPRIRVATLDIQKMLRRPAQGSLRKPFYKKQSNFSFNTTFSAWYFLYFLNLPPPSD